MTPSRRTILRGLAALPAVASAACAGPSSSESSAGAGPAPGQRVLIKGGHIATLDPAIGDIENGDLLIDGTQIADVGRNLQVADAMVVDASNQLVLPGLIDSHRHTWQTLQRTLIPDGDFRIYMKTILGTMAPRYRPEDVYIGNLFGCLGAMNSGITTMLDWSHIMNTPAHADAAVHGLRDSGIRAVFGHGYSLIPTGGDVRKTPHPVDIRRVQKTYFNSDDQLVTLAFATRGPETQSFEFAVNDLKLARELGLRTTMHVGSDFYLSKARAITKLSAAGLLGSDITHVHTLFCTDDELKMIADSGGTISTSSANEILTGNGFPSVQRWLRYGLRPSISIDNEVRSPTDLFTQMRGLLMSDRALEIERAEKSGGRPILVKARDILEFGTVEGAKALGLARKTGTLTRGKKADVILIDLAAVNLMPVNVDPVATAVMLGQASNVSWVFIDGKLRKREGKLVGVDLDRIRALVADSHAYLERQAAL